MASGGVGGWGLASPRILLRVEGIMVFVLAVILYWMNGGSWVLFGALILAPDLSMLGYLAGRRVGAGVYNAFHSYALAGVLAAGGLFGGSAVVVAVALIWFAHIGVDRAVGYGLKYAGGFDQTHLGRV
ncbi:MAG TPA: DUF4260 domain-containing protein [Rubrobacteraceae bacterium]|nr:DUF4260 domain-containing protein [Rubrobacteraceae bacterium]